MSHEDSGERGGIGSAPGKRNTQCKIRRAATSLNLVCWRGISRRPMSLEQVHVKKVQEVGRTER